MSSADSSNSNLARRSSFNQSPPHSPFEIARSYDSYISVGGIEQHLSYENKASREANLVYNNINVNNFDYDLNEGNVRNTSGYFAPIKGMLFSY